ncbi:IclR family transcriptional regulator [Natrarchaeobius sp. A-rgal3]|uniref:IclR family transcriptional regulator n=1 Tax=Natrarchaeobius versutus TaxID=1679078 RepID=UPI0035109AFA
MTDKPRYTVDATETSLAILTRLVESPEPLGVTALADEVGVSKGVTHNHLATLQHHEYVINRNGTYEPSLRLLSIGTRVRDRRQIYATAREKIANLAAVTGETATLFVAEDDSGVPLHVAETPNSWSPPYVEGERIPLHVNAPGKAILAALPNDRADAILTRTELAAPTDETITNPTELADQLRRIRDDRASFCREEHYDGIVGVAASIPNPTGTRPAAIGVCGPASRMNGRYLEEDITGQVLSTTKAVQAERAGE